LVKGANILTLGIDVGTGGIRVLILDERGHVLASATEEHAQFASPEIGWAEQHPEDWWRACCAVIPKAMQHGGLKPDDIACIGFSGQMHGAVLLEEQGKVVRPALIWCDVRTNRQCRELTEKIGAAQLIQATCNPALVNFTLPKLMWVREHEPENWKRVRSIMLPKDYVRFRMTGERATDVADASGTLLLDVAHRRWSNLMIEAAAVDERSLPTLFESPDVCAKVSAEGARAAGLRQGTPVVAGAGDQAAGAVGMGIVAPGTVSATIGTSGVVFAATDRPALEPGVFSLLFGSGAQIGTALMKHPLVKAGGFTGSRAAGRLLMDIAAARPEPIPFYAEMSSTNPVFVLPGALRERGESIAMLHSR